MPAPDLERRFQAWKATTSNLIAESLLAHGQVQQPAFDAESHAPCFTAAILKVLSPFIRNFNETTSDQLRNIIENAIGLDQKISSQPVRIEWEIPSMSCEVRFDRNCMAAEVGAAPVQAGQRVELVTAPAIRKWGNSLGENFDIGTLLLPMDVVCTPSPPELCTQDRRTQGQYLLSSIPSITHVTNGVAQTVRPNHRKATVEYSAPDLENDRRGAAVCYE